MTTAPKHAARFFRFPAQIAPRVMHLVRAERIDCHAAGAVYRLRHVEADPVRPLPVDGKPPVKTHVRVARITVRF